MTKLTEEGRKAKNLVDRLCRYVSSAAGRKFTAEMSYEESDRTFEGHIIDSGKCVEDEDGNLRLSEEGEDIGMIFWGGFYSLDECGDAESKAWESLLEDCIGHCCDKDIADIHNLTEALRQFGPGMDVNFESAAELENFLNNKHI